MAASSETLPERDYEEDECVHDDDGRKEVDAFLIFTLTYFEAWKFYTQKCVNLRQKLPRNKIVLSTTVCKITHIV